MRTDSANSAAPDDSGEPLLMTPSAAAPAKAKGGFSWGSLGLTGGADAKPGPTTKVRPVAAATAESQDSASPSGAMVVPGAAADDDGDAPPSIRPPAASGRVPVLDFDQSA